jgi:hypothetical protein
MTAAVRAERPAEAADAPSELQLPGATSRPWPAVEYIVSAGVTLPEARRVLNPNRRLSSRSQGLGPSRSPRELTEPDVSSFGRADACRRGLALDRLLVSVILDGVGVEELAPPEEPAIDFGQASELANLIPVVPDGVDLVIDDLASVRLGQ